MSKFLKSKIIPYLMIFAISTNKGEVGLHFGRVQQYTLITVEDQKLTEKKVITNPGHYTGNIPKFLYDRGVNVIITGGMGPGAMKHCIQYDIEVIVGITGKINDLIKEILLGNLKPSENLCVPGTCESDETGVEKIHVFDGEKFV